METVLGYVTQVATTLFSVATSAMDWVMNNELALIGAISFIVVMGIGICRKLVRGV